MNTKQKIALGLVAGATIISGVYGVSAANAATETTLHPMIQGIAEKFGINKDEVQKYVSEQREATRETRQVEREAALNTKLTEAVTAGKITDAQKTAILTKHEEMQAKREVARNLTGEERRTKMEELRNEMQEFLKTQGIDTSVMPAPQGPRAGAGMGSGFGGGMHRGNR